MLVCPSCRVENLEDATVCRHCGNGLDPSEAPMRSLDRPVVEEPQLDLPPPRRQNPWPIVIGGLVVGLALLGWGLYAALQPDPCIGKYRSAQFPYCADLPAGWAGGLALAGAETYEDRFQVSAEGDAQATVRVEEVLDPTVATQQYVQQFRTSQAANGVTLGDPEQIVLDGEPAFAWGYTLPQGTGADLRVREVVLVRPDGAWRIQLIAEDVAYETARLEFEQLLASWRWNS